MIKKIAFLLLIFSSCVPRPADKKLLEKEIMKTDQDFSNMSVEKGMKEAFLFYAADTVIMIRQGQLPLFGKAELTKQLQSRPDKNIHLRWVPVIAEASGNLGYTFGKWELRIT